MVEPIRAERFLRVYQRTELPPLLAQSHRSIRNIALTGRVVAIDFNMSAQGEASSGDPIHDQRAAWNLDRLKFLVRGELQRGFADGSVDFGRDRGGLGEPPLPLGL